MTSTGKNTKDTEEYQLADLLETDSENPLAVNPAVRIGTAYGSQMHPITCVYTYAGLDLPPGR